MCVIPAVHVENRAHVVLISSGYFFAISFLLFCYILVGESLAGGALWQILQRRLLHYP